MKTISAYVDLDGFAIPLGRLDSEERRLLARIERRYRSQPDWSEFDNCWLPAVAEFYDARGLRRSETIETSIYHIAQDMSARLGIDQGMVRAPEYLDQLEDLVLNRFASRRAFCKASGLSEETLDAVLAGEKVLSLERLSKALERAGYGLRIVRARVTKRTG